MNADEHVSDVRYFLAGSTWPAGWAARCSCGWRAGRPFDALDDAETAWRAHRDERAAPVVFLCGPPRRKGRRS